MEASHFLTPLPSGIQIGHRTYGIDFYGQLLASSVFTIRYATTTSYTDHLTGLHTTDNLTMDRPLRFSALLLLPSPDAPVKYRPTFPLVAVRIIDGSRR